MRCDSLTGDLNNEVDLKMIKKLLLFWAYADSKLSEFSRLEKFVRHWHIGKVEDVAKERLHPRCNDVVRLLETVDPATSNKVPPDVNSTWKQAPLAISSWHEVSLGAEPAVRSRIIGLSFPNVIPLDLVAVVVPQSGWDESKVTGQLHQLRHRCVVKEITHVDNWVAHQVRWDGKAFGENEQVQYYGKKGHNKSRANEKLYDRSDAAA